MARESPVPSCCGLGGVIDDMSIYFCIVQRNHEYESIPVLFLEILEHSWIKEVYFRWVDVNPVDNVMYMFYKRK